MSFDAAPMAGEVEDRLRAYAELLSAWTGRINLISRADVPHLWSRHIADSLRLLALMPRGVGHALDLGAGAGLPGLVLAIASGVPFTLVESDRRKAAFLAEAARLTAAPVTVAATRIERLPPQAAPLITARALAPLPRLLELAAPHLAPGGTLLLPKGARVGGEIAAARAGWRFGLERAGPPASPVLVLTAPERLARPADGGRADDGRAGDGRPAAPPPAAAPHG